MATLDNDEMCILINIVSQQNPETFDNPEYKAVIYKAKSLIVDQGDGTFYTKPVTIIPNRQRGW